MTTYELPPQPPVGTRLVDKDGTEWVRTAETLWHNGENRYSTWTALMEINGPLTEVPAPSLPTEDGALIIASGVVGDSRVTFTRATLVRAPSGSWWGASAATHRGIVFLPDNDDLTSWIEAVAVPKDKLDALRDEVRSVVAAAGADLNPDPYIASRARSLIDAVDGAS